MLSVAILGLGEGRSTISLVAKPSKLVWRVWIALIVIMIALYIFFNGF